MIANELFKSFISPVVGLNDAVIGRDACFWHANVLSKAVFSYAMTIMDEICGWEDEQNRVGSKVAACMWIYTKEVSTSGQIRRLRMLSRDQLEESTHRGRAR